MKLIYLHGSPGTGKLTIAKELQKLINCKILHNHLTIDIGKSLYEFGNEPFWNLVHELRIVSIKHSNLNGIKVLIYTSAYSHHCDLIRFQNIQSTCIENNIELLPFFLTATVNNLKERITSPHRKEMKKIATVEGLELALSEFQFAPLPMDNVIIIDTDVHEPCETAKIVIKNCGILQDK